MKKLFILTLACAALASCQKDQDTIPVEGQKAMVKFSSPAIHKHYHPGDTIVLSGMASAPEIMHGYDVMIFNKDNGDTLFHEHGHAHGTSITFEHKLVNPGDEEYYTQAFIKVYTNHDKDFVADSVDFHYLVK